MQWSKRGVAVFGYVDEMPADANCCCWRTSTLTNVWLAHWMTSKTGNGTSPNTSYHHLSQHQLYLDTYTDTDPTSLSVKYYLIVYGLIAVSNSFFSLIRAFLFACGGIWAAR